MKAGPLNLIVGYFAIFLALACPGLAEETHSVAGIVAGQSKIVIDGGRSGLLRLGLTKAVPYRVFTLAAPNRLVFDFREVDWTDLPPDFGQQAGLHLRTGVFRPGWTRMILDLNSPMAVTSVELQTDDLNPVLEVVLSATSHDQFLQHAGEVSHMLWKEDTPHAGMAVGIPPRPGTFRVAIDAGHGGIDPGAIREGVAEKDIVLAFAHQLKQLLEGSGRYEVLLTRDSDSFLSLRERVQIARRQSADVFISIHTNIVTQGDASGAAVHVLSDVASDDEARYLAEQENRSDVFAGVSLEGETDEVAQVLVELAQVETQARSRMFGEVLVKSLDESVGVISAGAMRSADFKVLKAPDIPSLLLELGFLSNDADRENMLEPIWRLRAAVAVLKALDEWVAKDEEATSLMRR